MRFTNTCTSGVSCPRTLSPSGLTLGWVYCFGHSGIREDLLGPGSGLLEAQGNPTPFSNLQHRDAVGIGTEPP